MTPWCVVSQSPLSMGFSWQEYWSGLPFPSPGDLPYPGIEPASPALAGIFLTIEPPGKPLVEGMLTLKRLLYLRKEENNEYYSVFFKDTEQKFSVQLG